MKIIFAAPLLVTARVRCGGSAHRVCWDGNRIFFPDHPHLAREQMLSEFGGRCRCLVVRQAWRKKARKHIPAELRSTFEQCRVARAEARARTKRASNLIASLRESEEKRNRVHHPRTIAAVRAALQQCCYRSSPVGPRHESIARVGPRDEPSGRVRRPSAEGGRVDPLSARSFPPDTVTSITIVVGNGWLRNVFERGLAVVDGHLILDTVTESAVSHRRLVTALRRPESDPWWVTAFGEEPDLARGPLVLAVAQGRGYAVRARPARVVEVPSPDGRTRNTLRWS